MAGRPIDLALAVSLVTCAGLLSGCGGRGAGDATPIPSTGVPIAAVGARGVDMANVTPPPVLPTDPFAPTPPGIHPHPGGATPGMPDPGTGAPDPGLAIPPDPFAPPVSPPPLPPAPTSTGVPL